MTTVWWVRHGPTHERAMVGHRDVPADLSDQALIDRVGAHLPQEALVVSSDLCRARDTALAIAGDRPVLPPLPGLREFDFGAWDGLDFEQVAARDPELSRRFWEQPGDLAAPGGESWNAVAARASAAIDRVITQHPAPHVIAVAHFGVILTQLARAAGCSPYQALGHRIDNFSITDMTRAAGGWRLGAINHLP